MEARPTLGSSQGSPLSPLLWNVIVHEILCLKMPTGVTTQAYVDDTLIIIPADSKRRLEELGSEVLRRVLDWARVAKVRVNKGKTFCALFLHGQGGQGMKSHLTEPKEWIKPSLSRIPCKFWASLLTGPSRSSSTPMPSGQGWRHY